MSAITVADAALRAAAAAAATSVGVAKVFYENFPDAPTAPEWISVAVQWSDSGQATLGSSGFDRTSGILTFVVATEVKKGAARGVEIADAIRSSLRSAVVGAGVTLRVATIRSIGAGGGAGFSFWQTNVLCPFFVTHRSQS